MTLESLTDALNANPEIASPTLKAILTEIQGLKITVVAGAGATTNIAVTGIATVDTLLSVLQLVGAGSDVTDIADRTGEASITSAGNIQLSSTDTSGSKLIVVWYDKS